MNTLSYPWAFLFGLYFYLLFQIVHVVRFGELNFAVQLLDLLLVVVGIVSVLIYMYFAKKLPAKRGLLLIAFLCAVPFAYFGALGGGLLGAIGVLVFGLIPFAVFLPLGYWLIKRFAIRGSQEIPHEIPLEEQTVH